MSMLIPCGRRSGELAAPVSKSALHRLLITAAFGARECEIICGDLPDDADATARCLCALGAEIRRTPRGLCVGPIRGVREGECVLHCGESAATLRFLMPLVGVLGARARFVTQGRLAERPIEPLAAELCRHGMDIRRDGADILEPD